MPGRLERLLSTAAVTVFIAIERDRVNLVSFRNNLRRVSFV